MKVRLWEGHGDGRVNRGQWGRGNAEEAIPPFVFDYKGGVAANVGFID